jgi:hypothetical protein
MVKKTSSDADKNVIGEKMTNKSDLQKANLLAEKAHLAPEDAKRLAKMIRKKTAGHLCNGPKGPKIK